MSELPANEWMIWKGHGKPHDGIRGLPSPPPWRQFSERLRHCADSYQPTIWELEAVNAALYLRRPLLVTGAPGSGKSALAHAVAHELKLGKVLHWPINSSTSIDQGLYRYDAITRLREANLKQTGHADQAEPEDIGSYIQLQQLGTAFLPSPTPRVVLIDEIDKSDMDFPNDLLHIFEEGEFSIPELQRQPGQLKSARVMTWRGEGDAERVEIVDGKVVCTSFPFVVLTSNGYRELPPPFLRRCIRLDLKEPDEEQLVRIVNAHLESVDADMARTVIRDFITRRECGVVATDQLLNALYLLRDGRLPDDETRKRAIALLLRDLGSV